MTNNLNLLGQITNTATSSPNDFPNYDDNGNLTELYDGSFDTANYDDENRLISVQVLDYWRTDFVYDGLGRLRQRNEWDWDGANWHLNDLVNYIYDGWRVIQERNSGNNPTVSYTRGNDLSGSMEGAGGIGGLLARSSGYSGGNWTSHNYYFADGNGNITYMLNSSQTMVASYRYDPFGNTISSSGTLASANVYRFSSKEIHVNSGMYYYGYRFYHPNLQRWINRDPLQENGGINLYAFAVNDPIDQTDPLGLDVGTIRILSSQPVGRAEWNVRFRWTPPKDICCRCKKAVWVQNKDDTVDTVLFVYHSVGVDWDETNYLYPQQQSELWTCGQPNMDMWDTPAFTIWSRAAGAVSRKFRATSKVKCIEGPDKDSIYGTVTWWFSWTRNPQRLTGGATTSLGAIAGP